MENMSFKRVFYVGLDVHKNSISYAVRDQFGQIVVEGKTAGFYKAVKEALEPYLLSCVVGLEACCCFYHIYKGFKDDGVKVKVANMHQIRQLITKNDTLDARRLAEMLRINSFPESYIPDENIKRLRSLVKFRHGVRTEKISLKNKIHSILIMNGAKIPHKPFTNSWTEIFLKYLKESDSFELRIAYDYYLSTAERLKRVEKEMIAFVEKNWPREFQKLKNLDGFGEILSSYIISETHPMSRFSNEKKLRRYAGVVPATKESDNTTYYGRIPKTSSRKLLRYALTSAATSIIRTKTKLSQYYYKKKKQKKSYKMAKLAVANTISNIVYKTLTTN